MKIIELNKLTNIEMKQIADLSEACDNYEAYFEEASDSKYNCFFLYYSDDSQGSDLISFLSFLSISSANSCDSSERTYSSYEAEITAMTHPAFRHKGYFTSLLQLAHSELAKAGISNVYCAVPTTHALAQPADSSAVHQLNPTDSNVAMPIRQPSDSAVMPLESTPDFSREFSHHEYLLFLDKDSFSALSANGDYELPADLEINYLYASDDDDRVEEYNDNEDDYIDDDSTDDTTKDSGYDTDDDSDDDTTDDITNASGYDTDDESDDDTTDEYEIPTTYLLTKKDSSADLDHIGICHLLEEDAFTNIWGVEIIKQYRRQGLGFIFIKNVISDYFQLTSKPLVLNVSSTNVAACHLYFSCGFKIKEQVDYFKI